MFGSQLDTDHGLVLDLLDSLGELQGLERFLKMGVFSAGGTKQGCLGVASKTLFQQLCERGFSEWNIAAFTQGLDDATKNSERQVDLLGLFEYFAGGSGLSNTLRTGQIDEVEFGILFGSVLVDLVVLEHQDRMTSAAPIVHARRLRVHSVLSPLDVVKDCLGTVDHDLVGVDDFATHHLQVPGGVFVWLQQIV